MRILSIGESSVDSKSLCTYTGCAVEILAEVLQEAAESALTEMVCALCTITGTR